MLQPSPGDQRKILADVSGEEVEAWLLRNGLVKPNNAVPGADQPAVCPTNFRVPAPAASGIGFRR